MVLEGQVFSIDLNNEQNGVHGADPEYLMLSMNDDNALCVSAILASANGVNWAWYGDIGKRCGGQWYYSDKPYGQDSYAPACTWISGPDHPHGYQYQGFGIHMPDFNADPGLVAEYNEHPDAVCGSSRRFKMYEEIVPDAIVPCFEPPLKFNPDGSDEDLAKVIDKKQARHKRDAKVKLQKRGNNNNDPSTLIVSEHDGHSAKENFLKRMMIYSFQLKKTKTNIERFRKFC